MQRTAPLQYSRLSPMSQTSKTPVSGKSFQAMASLSFLGGSRTSSSVSTQVPVTVSTFFNDSVSTILTPMNAERFLALCVDEDVDAVERIGVHRRHDESRVICSDGNKAKVERSSEFANLLEGRTCRVGVLFIVVVLFFWKVWHRAVTSISSKPDLFAAAFYAPRAPKSVTFIERRTRTGVLTRQAADDGFDIFGTSSVHSRASLGVCTFRVFLIRRQGKVSRLPPIQLGHVFDTTFAEPLLVSQWSPEMNVGMLLLNFEDGRI